MHNKICGINNIRLYTSCNGFVYNGGVSIDGLELSNIELLQKESPCARAYKCMQCLNRFDGSETFDDVLNHIGKYNEPQIFE